MGWYSTGPKLKEADLDISALMSKFTDGCAEPVLVICDVEVSGHPALRMQGPWAGSRPRMTHACGNEGDPRVLVRGCRQCVILVVPAM